MKKTLSCILVIVSALLLIPMSAFADGAISQLEKNKTIAENAKTIAERDRTIEDLEAKVKKLEQQIKT